MHAILKRLITKLHKMKFSNIYTNTEKRAEEALLSLWTPGDHPMRAAFTEMLKKEPLLGEPVFQSLFGWETTKDDEWRNYLNPNVINALHIGKDKEGKPRPPYLHQVKSWKALSSQTGKKSIVVTSGTGSGKTECFMYPVLNDLYLNKQQGAIQAIFLYPLNALMEDQCKRLGEDCEALDLHFAVYNGNTEEHRADNGIYKSEIRTRKAIRNKDTTPQILLTNPSMLEYMLLRDADQELIKRSQGKLKWIVIDEAHTYSGSAAVELSNQIRRILNAFGTTPDQVHFACTSATIGESETLLDFISFLISQDKKDIDIVDGNRQVPDIDNDVLQECLNNNTISTTASAVQNLRNEISKHEGLTLKEIWTILNVSEEYSPIRALELIDKLCEAECHDTHGKLNNILMVRAHFFMRVINGIYACVNPDCAHYTASPIGQITTYRSATCEQCGSAMLELVQCKECGKILLSGEYDVMSKEVRSLEWISPDENPFALQDDNEEDNVEEDINGWVDHSKNQDEDNNDDNKAFWWPFMVGCDRDNNGYQKLDPDVELFGIHFLTSTAKISYFSYRLIINLI